jgi:hypothetical protein
MALTALCFILALIANAVQAAQQPLLTSAAAGWTGTRASATSLSIASQPRVSGHEVYEDALFKPLGDTSTLSETEFTRMGHLAFPHYSVRVKKTKFCDGIVK